MSTSEPGDARTPRLPDGVVGGVAVPLTLIALSYVLWWIADQVVVIGPLDRASFGWLVVVPLWLTAPVAAGFSWRGLDRRTSAIVAAVVGGSISGVAALQFWRSVSNPACEYGPAHAPDAWIVPSLALGALIGGGVAISALVARRYARNGARWRAVVLGAGTESIFVFVAILFAGIVLQGPGCNRPPV